MTRDEERIAQRSGATYCTIVPANDKGPARGRYVMAVFGTDPFTRQHYSFLVRTPYPSDWREQVIKRLLSMKREKA